MHVNEKKDYGAIRPGFDPKDAKYFWDESLPDSEVVTKDVGCANHTNNNHAKRNCK